MGQKYTRYFAMNLLRNQKVSIVLRPSFYHPCTVAAAYSTWRGDPRPRYLNNNSGQKNKDPVYLNSAPPITYHIVFTCNTAPYPPVSPNPLRQPHTTHPSQQHPQRLQPLGPTRTHTSHHAPRAKSRRDYRGRLFVSRLGGFRRCQYGGQSNASTGEPCLVTAETDSDFLAGWSFLRGTDGRGQMTEGEIFFLAFIAGG